MKTYLVGSAIHGDLLSPNDRDLAVICDTKPEIENLAIEFGKAISDSELRKDFIMSCHRKEDINIILLFGHSIKEYVKGMDFNIVRGYKDLSTGKLWLSKEAELGLKNKTIEYLGRSENYKKLFTSKYEEDRVNERRSKYASKLPSGWKLIIQG
jgi:predicted nucleotidyltransferase